MKKLLIILIFIPLISFGQAYRNPGGSKPIKIQVSQAPKTSADHYRDMQKSLSNSFSQAVNNSAANARAAAIARAANANAQSEALKNNYTKVEIDLLKGSSNKYKFLVIKQVSGWSTSANFVTITNKINGANKYSVVSLNSLGLYVKDGAITSKTKKYRKFIKQIDERQFYEPFFPPNYLTDSETLFLYWSREAISQFDRLTRLILKNSDGETVYEAEYKNKGFSEMLKPLLSDYNFGIQDAKNKLIELKEYLDLGIITQDEFNENTASLKKILLGNTILKAKKIPEDLPLPEVTDSEELIEENYIITTLNRKVIKARIYRLNKAKGIIDIQTLDGKFIRLKVNTVTSVSKGGKEIFKK